MTLIFKNDLSEDGVQGTLIHGNTRKEDGQVYKYIIPATDEGEYNQIPGEFYTEEGPVGHGILTNINLTCRDAWFDIVSGGWYPMFIPDEPWDLTDITRTLLCCDARTSVVISLIEKLREKHPDLSEDVVNLIWDI